MSRHGFVEGDDWDESSQWAFIRTQGALKSAIRGKRGQLLLQELLTALDAMPEKKLVSDTFQAPQGEVCALGAVAAHRGCDVSKIQSDLAEPLEENDDPEYVISYIAGKLNIARALAQEIMWVNDLGGVTSEERWQRVRNWAKNSLIKESE